MKFFHLYLYSQTADLLLNLLFTLLGCSIVFSSLPDSVLLSFILELAKSDTCESSTLSLVWTDSSLFIVVWDGCWAVSIDEFEDSTDEDSFTSSSVRWVLSWGVFCKNVASFSSTFVVDSVLSSERFLCHRSYSFLLFNYLVIIVGVYWLIIIDHIILFFITRLIIAVW